MSDSGRAARVSAEEFVRAWVDSSSLKEVASKTGLKVDSVRSRASHLRRRGVRLPKFRAGGVDVDVDDLNRLIQAQGD